MAGTWCRTNFLANTLSLKHCLEWALNKLNNLLWFHFISLYSLTYGSKGAYTVVVAVAKQTRFGCPNRGLEDSPFTLSTTQTRSSEYFSSSAWNAGALVICILAFLIINGTFKSVFRYNSEYFGTRNYFLNWGSPLNSSSVTTTMAFLLLTCAVKIFFALFSSSEDWLCRLSHVRVWFRNYILLCTYWGMRRYSVAGINFLVICSSINGLFFFSRLQQNCKFFCSGAVVLTESRTVLQ